MAYAVLTEPDLLERAEQGAESHADRLAAALTAMEEHGYLLASVDRPQGGDALYVFHGSSGARRLNNIR
jgi:hypothetical protein